MYYYKNNETGSIAIFNRRPSASEWTELTQEEKDAYLLAKAKIVKLATLGIAKETFCVAGFPYDEVYFCLSDAAINAILLQNRLFSYESSDVSVVASTKKYTLPSGHGLTFWATQHIEFFGFTEGANNGEKTVVLFSGDEITVEETLADEAVGDAVSISTPNRYRQYDTQGIKMNFTDKAGWDDFFSKITPEKKRVEDYNSATKLLINNATTMAILDAITIDFSA